MKLANLILVVAGLGAFLLPAHAETVNCTEISTLPATISTSGTYCLKQDLTATTPAGGVSGPFDAAIAIEADGVVLDLNGHSLTHATPGPAAELIGIRAFDRKNVTIRNGHITGFSSAVSLLGIFSEYHLVEDIRASNNSEIGLTVIGANTIVRNNVITNTGPSDKRNYAAGIGIVYGQNSVVHGNIIQGVTETNKVTGIGVTLSPSAEISNNSVLSVTGASENYAVELFGATGAAVLYNHFNDSSGAGTEGVRDAGFSDHVGCIGNVMTGFPAAAGGCDTVSGNTTF